MKETKELLLTERYQIIAKQNYYENKIRNKSKLISEATEKANDSEIFPYIFDRYNPRYQGLSLYMFSSILTMKGGFMDFLYIEDENPELTWTVIEMDENDGVNNYVYLFTKHYYQRFQERNSAYRRYTGNPKEAMILDVFSGACLYYSGVSDELYGQIIDPEKLQNMTPEKRFKWRETLQTLAGTNYNIGKYFNENTNTSIMKTIDGYGIYKKEKDFIIMLTWLRDDQLTPEQKNLAETLMEFVKP